MMACSCTFMNVDANGTRMQETYGVCMCTSSLFMNARDQFVNAQK